MSRSGMPCFSDIVFLTSSFLSFGRFYFNFSPSYVGFGLISPHIVNCSVFLGSVVSWGFLHLSVHKLVIGAQITLVIQTVLFVCCNCAVTESASVCETHETSQYD